MVWNKMTNDYKLCKKPNGIIFGIIKNIREKDKSRTCVNQSVYQKLKNVDAKVLKNDTFSKKLSSSPYCKMG